MGIGGGDGCRHHGAGDGHYQWHEFNQPSEITGIASADGFHRHRSN